MKAKELKDFLKNIPDDIDIKFLYNFPNYIGIFENEELLLKNIILSYYYLDNKLECVRLELIKRSSDEN